MAHVRRFRQGNLGANRRKTGWFEGPSQKPEFQITAAGSVLWALGSLALGDGLTTIRIRGMLTVNLVVTTSVGDGFDSCAAGICYVTGEAFAAGIASVPTPLSDMDWDGWMWHQILGRFRGAETTEVARFPMEAGRFPIDSKAMRKSRAGDVLIGVFEAGAETGASTLGFSADTRILDKLA